MRAVVYVRQSQDRADSRLAVGRQREDCRRLCEQRGWTIVHELTDNDISATSRKPRPAFDQLLRLVDSGAVDVVVVAHVDRLVRRLADLEDVIERCQKADVRLAAVGGDLDLSTDAGRLVGRILASVARGEVERKSDRQQRAQAQAATQGRRVGGRRPFGYERDGVTVRSAEAKAIRAGYTAALSGLPLAAIARDWNARGLRPGQERRDGTPSSWRHDNVRAVLLNPRNAALRQHRGEIVGPAVWPALVDEDVYRATVDLLVDPTRRQGGSHGATGLLTGVARCSVCGDTVHLGRSKRGQRIYRCRGSYGHVSRQAEPVEDYVGQVAIARLSRPDALDLLRTPKRPETAELRDQAQALRQRLDSLATDFADGDLTAGQLRAATERIRTRLADVEAHMADAGRADLLGPLVAAPDATRAWGQLDDDRRRKVLDTLMTVTLLPPGRGTRTFDPDTVAIDWRAG